MSTPLQRVEGYSGEHCWQYDMRLKNLESDLALSGISREQSRDLVVGDFDFKFVENPELKKELKSFIERHEWLGNLSQFNTHYYGAYLKSNGVLAGVQIFNMPNAFSKVIGPEYRDLERLISRGACISWSPKNLASNFLMWCIRDMVSNTRYRLFSAYSDPIAKELGTIYQACNFYYMGAKFGSTVRCKNPYTGQYVSDRFFRQRTAYKKYAEELELEWEKTWNTKHIIHWDLMPEGVEDDLRKMSKAKFEESEKIHLPKKHKYIMVLGRDRRETRKLRSLYESLNKILPYPKNRG